ncbi:MAG: hypothetical protein E6Q97_32515 [Desulfurellales bacterium]|nr:MAG: hypothetical protein E6Q97_32515 [Desulfurellales bacterium]
MSSDLVKRLQTLSCRVSHGEDEDDDDDSTAIRQGIEALEAEVARLNKLVSSQAVNCRQNSDTMLLRQCYVTLAFAFSRLHESARSRDGELCLDFQRVRALIEKRFREIGIKL